MEVRIALLLLAITYIECTTYHIPLHRRYTTYAPSRTPDNFSAEYLNGTMTELLAMVTLGTPPQEFLVLLDTGSSDLWVVGQNCSGLTGQDTFNPAQSTTYEVPTEGYANASIAYDKGAVVGVYGSDTLSIDNFTLSSITFIQATQISNITAPEDGILGLGFPQLAYYDYSDQSSIPSYPTFLETIMNEHLIEDASFSFYISENTSVFVLGGIDPRFAQGPMQYFPIAGEGFWSVYSDLIYNGNEILYENILTIFDTGTSAIKMPAEVLSEFMELTGVSNTSFYTSDQIKRLSSFTIKIGSGSLTIPPSSYMNCLDGFYFLWIFVAPPLFDDGSFIVNQIILGDLFLQTYYTHFDYKNMRIGFAEPAIL